MGVEGEDLFDFLPTWSMLDDIYLVLQDVSSYLITYCEDF